MAIAYTKNVIVCGLAAQRVKIISQSESVDCATWDDPLGRIAMPPVHTADFEFAFLSNAEIDIARLRFPVGSGTPFQGHDLGPADVCQFCGTAWLPGTLRCPSCGGATDHAERAIEYAARQAGRIIETQLEMPLSGYAVFRVKAEFTALVWPAGGIETMFQHSLWHVDPALWICRFCGHGYAGRPARGRDGSVVC